MCLINRRFVTDSWHHMTDIQHNVFWGLGRFWSRSGLQCECGVDRRTGPTHGRCRVPRCIQVGPTAAVFKPCNTHSRDKKRQKHIKTQHSVSTRSLQNSFNASDVALSFVSCSYVVLLPCCCGDSRTLSFLKLLLGSPVYVCVDAGD